MSVNTNPVFAHLETERLLLRKPNLADVAEVFVIHSDPQTNQYNPHGPMKSPEEAIERVHGWIRDWEQDGIGYWTVLSLESHEVVGFGGIRRFHWADRDVFNLYYRFSAKSWGHGYATEVARAAVQFAHHHFPGLPIIARISPTNTLSIKVAERVGMVPTPELNTSEFMIFTLGWD